MAICAPGMPADTVLTLAEIAEQLDVGLGAVRGWIASGQLIPEERDGRVVVACAELLLLQWEQAEAHHAWATEKLGDHIALYGAENSWDSFSYWTARAQWITKACQVIGQWHRRLCRA